MTTFSDLVQKCIVELRQEPGISVQQYAEDIIAAILQRQFNVFFDHYWWPRYQQGGQFTLNGTTGRVTEDLTNTIKRLDDIRYIWYKEDAQPIPVHPPMLNPWASHSRMYYYPDASDKIFWITPPTTEGYLRILYRTKPAPFVAGDEVRIDDDLLVCATCFNYLADDEDAPNSVKKFQEATAKREAQLREAMNSGPIPFGGGSSNYMTEWTTS